MTQTTTKKPAQKKRPALSKTPRKINGAKAPLITRDMTIDQVLQKHPKAADIMQMFGLHCFGCSVNTLETLEEGIIGHGMPESTLNEMLDALNDNLEKYQKDMADKGVYLTERGALKIVELAKIEGRTGYGIRVKIMTNGGCCTGPTYSMDFEEKASEGDKILGFHHGVTLYVDPESFEQMRGSTIDYIVTYEAEGFKIDNPSAKPSTGACKCRA